MNCSFVWMSYGPDSPCLLESVLQVLSLGVNPSLCAVAETRGKEIGPEVHAILEAKGVTFRTSDFHRSNSYESTQDLFHQVALQGELAGTDYVFQLDSDTMLTGLSYIKNAIAEDAVAMGWTWPGQRLAGCAWLIKTQACRDLEQAMATRHPCLDGIPTRIASDILTSHILDRLFGDSATVRHWFNSEGGFGKGWQYDPEIDVGMERWEMITFGNRHLIKGVKKCERREIVALTMARHASSLDDSRLLAQGHLKE